MMCSGACCLNWCREIHTYFIHDDDDEGLGPFCEIPSVNIYRVTAVLEPIPGVFGQGQGTLCSVNSPVQGRTPYRDNNIWLLSLSSRSCWCPFTTRVLETRLQSRLCKSLWPLPKKDICCPVSPLENRSVSHCLCRTNSVSIDSYHPAYNHSELLPPAGV